MARCRPVRVVTGGESGGSETEEYDGQLPLLELAEKVEQAGYFGGSTPAIGVADAASVSFLMFKMPLAASASRRFRRRSVRSSSALLRTTRCWSSKGQFAFKEAGREKCGPILRLTHFNPTPGYVSPRSGDEGDEPRADLIPIPEGIGLNVVLPDNKALTPAGSERIQRGDPFYAGLIAHSPSFNSETATLTCSAWAIWGENTPNWEGLAHYRYGGDGGIPGAC
jgi:hypothetical protein